MEGWIPRRMGGGFAGRKESGQLRFGARDRPFKRPLNVAVNQNMPEILPDQRFDDCWCHVGDVNSSSATQNYRSVFQYSKDSYFNRQDKSNIIPNNNSPNEERLTYNKRNGSPSRFHHEKPIDSSSRRYTHTNEFHRVEDKYHRERKIKRYSKSRSRSPSRYRHDSQYSSRHGEKSEHRRSRTRSPYNKHIDRYTRKSRRNIRDHEHRR